jgi:hypothetical protein
MSVPILIGTPESPARASFAHVFKPTKLPTQTDADLRYSIQLLVDKADQQFMNAYMTALTAAYEEAVGSKTWGGVRPQQGQFKQPLRDGDDPNVNKGRAEYMGKWVISAKSKLEYPPEVYNTNNVRLTSEEQFYSGCYCMAAGALFGYSTGGYGIGMLLNGLLFVKDGEKFSSMESPQETFKNFMKPAGFNALAMPGQNPMAAQVPGFAPSAVPPPMPNMQPPVQPGYNPMTVPAQPAPQQYAQPVQQQFGPSPLAAPSPMPAFPQAPPLPALPNPGPVALQPVNPMAQPFVTGPVPPPYPQQ